MASEMKFKDFKERINALKIALIYSEPFFGTLIAGLELREAKDMEHPAATNGKAIYYNPNMLENLSDREIMFILMHEVMHVARMHVVRTKNRNRFIWNIASDLIVNYQLVKNDDILGRFSAKMRAPKGILYADEEILGRISTENLYDMLYKQVQEQIGDLLDMFKGNDGSNNQSGSRGGGESEEQDEQQKDVNDVNEFNKKLEKLFESRIIKIKVGNTEIPIRTFGADLLEMNELGKSAADLERDLLSRIQEAATIAKRAGRLPGFVERMIDQLTGKKIKWYSYVRRYLSSVIDEETSYSTPDRMNLYRRVILPGETEEEKALNDIVLAIDTSGSITDDELRETLYQVKQLSEQFIINAWLIYWDDGIQGVYKFTNIKEMMKAKPKGGGGTDVNKVIDYVQENIKGYSCMIIMTDGYFIEKAKPARDIIWVLTQDGTDSYLSKGKVIWL